MHHDLKIFPEYFAEVMSGAKTFEIRKNDRNFKPGDTAMLHEYQDPARVPWPKFSGRKQMIHIQYVTDYHQQDGYVVFSFVRLQHRDNAE